MARSAAHLFHELGCYFLAQGHTVTVVTEFPWRRVGGETVPPQYQTCGFLSREVMDGLSVVRVKGFRFHEGSLVRRGINALLLPLTFLIGALVTGPQDVVLVYSPPLTLGLATYLYTRIRRIPFVFNVQDIYPQTLVELGLLKNRFLIAFFEWMEKFTYAHAARVVVHSHGNRQYLMDRRALAADRVTVIHNWISAQTVLQGEKQNGFRNQHQLGTRFLVTYAGTMGYAQDLNPIIQAAKTLQEYDDILLLLIGEGVRHSEWQQKVQQMHLQNVRFLPLQPKSVYPSIVSASDVGLVPLIERLRTPVVPGKLLDFMAGGRPVIATVNLDGDTSRIIREAQCGYAFSPDDSRGVAEAILALYHDQSMTNQLGSNGQHYAENHFSLRVCADQYEILFRQITSR